jgi:hypothetical protein
VTRKENPVEHGGRYVRPFGFSLLSPHGKRERERELLESSFLDEKNVKAMGRAERRRKVIFCCRGRSYDKYISVLVFFFFFYGRKRHKPIEKTTVSLDWPARSPFHLGGVSPNILLGDGWVWCMSCKLDAEVV